MATRVARALRSRVGLAALRARVRVQHALAPRLARLAPPETFLVARSRLARGFLRGEGIEIGGLNAPLPVPRGATVRYVDRWSLSELREQYPELGRTAIVAPDVIDDGERLERFDDASLDFVVANHFLEHTEDPIGTLEHHLRVIRPGGVLFVAVPDKRFTFDVERPVTPLEHVVRDYQEGPEWSRRAHYEEWVSTMHDGSHEVLEELLRGDRSIHFHVWTGREFLELLEHCRSALGFPFEVVVFERTGHEVVAVLEKT